jgi:hypothetical protein
MQKVVIIFFEISWEIVFVGGKFSVILTRDSERAFRSLTNFPFPSGVLRKIFGEKTSVSTDFAIRDALPAKITN